MGKRDVHHLKTFSENPHNHRINVIDGKNKHRWVVKDDVEEYKNNKHDIKFCCNCTSTIKCTDTTTLTYYLHLNADNIAREILKTQRAKFVDLWTILNKIIKMKKMPVSKLVLFLDMLCKARITFKEGSQLLDHASKHQEWDIVKYLLRLGYTPLEYDVYVANMNERRVYEDLFINQGFEVTEQTFLILLKNNVLTIDEVHNKHQKFWHLLKDTEYESQRTDMLFNIDAYMVKELLSLGMVVTDEQLFEVCVCLNLEVVIELVKNKYTLNDKCWAAILRVDYKKPKPKVKKKPSRRYLTRRTTRRHTRDVSWSQQYGRKKIWELDIDYDIHVVELLKLVTPTNFIRQSLQSRYYEFAKEYIYILEYILSNKLIVLEKLNIIQLFSLMHYIISDDDVKSFQHLCDLGVLRPIDISSKPKYFDLALRMSSHKILDHFVSLDMVCSPSVSDLFKTIPGYTWCNMYKYTTHGQPQLSKEEVYDIIVKIGCPVDQKILNILLKTGGFALFKKVHQRCQRGFTADNFYTALAYENYMIADYIRKQIPDKIKSKKMIDRVVTKICATHKNNNRFRRYFNQSQLTCTVKRLNILINRYSATAGSNSINKLIEYGFISCALHLHKKFKTKINSKLRITAMKTKLDNMWMNNISQGYWNQMNQFMNYCAQQTGSHVLMQLTNYELDDLITKLICNNIISMVEVVYEKTKREPTFSQLDIYCRERYRFRNCSVTKEMLMFFERFDIYPTRELYILIIKLGMTNYELIQYMNNKYDFKVTLHDLHTFIADGEYYEAWLDDDFLDKYKLSASPYTLELLCDRVRNDMWLLQNLKIYVEKVGKVTMPVYEFITNINMERLRNIHIWNYKETVSEWFARINPTIVEYDPDPAEIVVLQQFNDDYDHDDYDDIDNIVAAAIELVPVQDDEQANPV